MEERFAALTIEKHYLAQTEDGIFLHGTTCELCIL
jgi:hypothetical protein